MPSPRSYYCILSTQRSGSTWFRKLLESHPDIRAFGELFLMQAWEGWAEDAVVPFSHHRRDHPTARPGATWNYLRDLRECDDPASVIGFKLMYGQLASFPEMLVTLIRHRFKIVHLVRSNHLDMVISRERDERLGITHATEAVEVEALQLDPARLRRRLRNIAISVRAGRSLVSMWPHATMTVSYEALARDPETVVRDVVRFLGADPEGVHFAADLRRIASGSYADRIANFAEIEALLRQWGYGSFLSGE